jgi:hypothetical protein
MAGVDQWQQQSIAEAPERTDFFTVPWVLRHAVAFAIVEERQLSSTASLQRHHHWQQHAVHGAIRTTTHMGCLLTAQC